jgi:cyclic-di-GMP phosphodiesterase TipF (flagellum assembly factor)
MGRMSRVATILVVFAIAVTAISVAVVLAIQFAMPIAQAGAIGLCVSLALSLIHLQMERRRDRRWFQARIAEVASAASDANAELERVSVRLARLDGSLAERIRAESEPLAAEVEVLGHLLKQVADTLAEFELRMEKRLDEIAARAELPRPVSRSATSPVGDGPQQVGPFATPPVGARVEPVVEAPPVGVEGSGPPARIPTAFEREVETAIRGERIEIHLQPIVSLPQRKVRYYEVLTRLRSGNAQLIPAAEFLPVAESRGLVAKLDTFQVIRSFQILRRLTARNRDVGLAVNISPASLADTTFYREFSAFLSQNRSMADLVQFEFTQSAVREMGPLELESLSSLAEIGFRFSVDNVADLRMDFRALSDRGFRTVKLSVDRLLGRVPMGTGDIHPADLSGQLQRQGLALVVDRIETEAQVVDLLDYDVRLAQGYLFSAPRQVRPEILGGASAETAPSTKASGA